MEYKELKKKLSFNDFINLDIDINTLTNNELAEYLIKLELTINILIRQSLTRLVKVLVKYKLDIEVILTNRLSKKINQ